MEFQGYNGTIRIEGDDLVIDRAGVKGRFGGEELRRIPLDDVEGAYLHDAPEPRRPGHLQLLLADQPDDELMGAAALSSPDVVSFRARQQPAFERLWEWLENGGDLEEEEEEGPVAAPAAAAPVAPQIPSAPPAPAAPAPAPAPAAPANPFAVQDGPVAAAPTSFGTPEGVGAVRPRLGFVEAVRTVLSKYATFSGRARRSEYWWYSLALLIGYLVVAGIGAALGNQALLGLGFLALFVPSLAVTWRRLHDTGRSGAWYFLAFVPFGGLVLLAWLASDSTPEPNAHGPSPKHS